MFTRHLAQLGGTTSYGDCVEALKLLLTPKNLVGGERITEYERTFAGRAGGRHGISFSSGRVGLFAILKAMGIGEGDEVLLQVPTHIVVANSIRYIGASPVYVDCCADSYNIDLDHARRLNISDRTKALLVQHTYGIPVDMHAVQSFAEEHSLAIIEDCVHSLGACFDGQPTGSFGQASFFSTEETKMISTSLGGMVVCNDDKLAEEIRTFRDRQCETPGTWLAAQYLIKLICYQVLTEPYIHRYARAAYDFFGQFQPLPRPVSSVEWVGERPEKYLQQLSNGQAAMGLRQLRRLDENLAHRRAIAAIYLEELLDLKSSGQSLFPLNSVPSWCRYPVRVEDRAVVESQLKRYSVPGTWFSSVLEESSSPKFGHYVAGSCPNAESIVGHVINLPTHGRVRPDDARRLAAIVRAAID